MTWGLFMSSSLKAAIHLEANYTENLESIQEHGLQDNSEFVQSHTEIGIGTF